LCKYSYVNRPLMGTYYLLYHRFCLFCDLKHISSLS
jgi:hypothetical protein